MGIIHDIATFTPLIKEGLACLGPDEFKASIYMSLICGASLILSGSIQILLLKHTEKHAFLTKPILLIGAFLALNGILSVIYMFDNPFAWLALMLNLSMFLITIILNSRLTDK